MIKNLILYNEYINLFKILNIKIRNLIYLI